MDSITQLKAYATEVAGEWNGKDSGLLEDRAQIAIEMLDKIKELEALQDELEDF
jgi:hypothetical protein